MTNPPNFDNVAPAAGWFPDPTGGPGSRWWDGQNWTEHVSDPTLQAFSPAGVPRRVPQGTPVYTPFIWLITLLPLLAILAVALWDTDAYMRASLNSPNDPLAQYLDPGYLIVQALGFVIYGVTVLLAYFDWKTLAARGFDRPFHWAWTFLGGTVYIIGRTVIVRRRAGGGAMLPIWITIGVVVVSLIVVTVKIVGMVSVAMSYLTSY
ncbi:DUF2510 domain-containing protein [Agreia sp. VKM Ac-1783]|uniref:DUF2510 domain-containing protein n=1 Tax=Agreia sp. VKM Ac-1783 TaxID=1938889 RepID=UPI000A2AAFAB|nr:DUF2510 domain-containing protein [Agreia sp. VKM Ac-1783]SMQ71646.1 Protein of unknown function [Agreia sp. VKM Ac-1783]